MNHRDCHRDAEYFAKHLVTLERSIEVLEKSDNPQGQFQLLTFSMSWISSKYSSGAPVDDIGRSVHRLNGLLPAALEHFSPSVAVSIPLAALWCVFDIPERREKLYDYAVVPAGDSPRCRIVDLFLGDENAWDPDKYQGREIPKTISKHFWFAANAARSGSADASDLLVSFVRTHWYRSWRSAGWWGTHENQVHDSYSGYWCFEGAALAKMFDLDGSALRDHKYYPYDLVHP